jgi:diacylglycerol kinase family enzyme
MASTDVRPSAGRRAAAIAAIVLVASVVVATLVEVVAGPGRVLVHLALLALLLAGLWIALTRVSTGRVLGIAIAVAATIGIVVTLVGEGGALAASLTIRVGLLVGAVGLANYALGSTKRSLKAAEVPGTPVGPAARGVLFMNLKSGGGKAEHFHLVDECRRRRIEPVVLEPGQDWIQRVRDAATSGVDVLGMAGGDGSQAMVAAIAAESGLPMVVVPAGTRNHLALDLGLDRDDVVGALDAYDDAVERGLDLGDMNGHVFVNNVSLGLYAAIVRSPEYRAAKVDTTLATLPQVLGPDSRPFDLRFAGPDGAEHDGAHMIQVSNNPYGQTAAGMGSRPRLDTRRLGIISLVLGPDGGAAPFFAALASGHPERFRGFHAWSAPTFEVTSGEPIEIGLDGETQVVDPPLRFSIRPDQVRVRLPRHAPGYSPAARALGWRDGLRELWGIVLGHPSRFQR